VALTSASVSVRQLSFRQVELHAGIDSMPDLEVTNPGGDRWTVELKVWDRALTPSIIRATANRMPGARVLAIAPTVSAQARAVAAEYGWSVIATNPNRADGPTGILLPPTGPPIPIGSVDRNDHWETRTGTAQPEQEAASRTTAGTTSARPKGRPGYGTAWITRLLLTGQCLTQADLVANTALSQPRISQTLRQLQAAGLIRARGATPRQSARWEPVTWDGLLDHWLATYRGPGGTRTYWYSLDDATEAAEQVLHLLRDQEDADQADRPESARRRYRPVLSGPVGADKVAPWARPSVAVIYTTAGANLKDVGMTPATPGEATVQLVVPADPGVWLTPTAWPQLATKQVADPVQILWDLQNPAGSASTDADQAAAHLRVYLANAAATRRNEPDSSS
jgi:hypothetical protein